MFANDRAHGFGRQLQAFLASEKYSVRELSDFRHESLRFPLMARHQQSLQHDCIHPLGAFCFALLVQRDQSVHDGSLNLRHAFDRRAQDAGQQASRGPEVAAIKLRLCHLLMLHETIAKQAGLEFLGQFLRFPPTDAAIRRVTRVQRYAECGNRERVLRMNHKRALQVHKTTCSKEISIAIG